jgi:chemotaxis protein methyltransferase CheR
MTEAPALRRFEDLIRARSGINMREQEAPLLDKTLAARMQAHRFSTPQSYLDWLDEESAQTQSEWNHLFVLLTNQESYFFRDPGQLAVIREHVLPELVRRNCHTRTLRIWSAGCSTGEEPYSLAMMLDEVLPHREEWHVLLLGTDLSEAALERARSGVYGAWSFRALDSQKQERFFAACGNKWEVKPHLRRMVTFAPGNLLLDNFPSPATPLHDMDLIVCRNVFIYFDREAVARVIGKLSATLRPDGFLVTGHTELHDVPLGDLQARPFPQSVIYQRTSLPLPPANTPLPTLAIPKATTVPSAPPRPFTPKVTNSLPPIAPGANPGHARSTPDKPLSVAPGANQSHARPTLETPSPALPDPAQSPVVPGANPSPARSTPETPSPALPDAAQVTSEAKTWIQSGRYAAALTSLQALLQREPRHLGALCLAAQAQANAGRLEEAQRLCREALEVSPFASLPYHLLARIADERGDVQGAKALLKKVIYLNPASVHPLLELSAIYGREGDALRAAQMRRAALGAMENLAPNPMPCCPPTNTPPKFL